MKIAPLLEDSRFFGARLGRLVPDADEHTDLEAVARLDRSAFDCVFVEIGVEAIGELHRWQDLGARVVDARIELSTPLEHPVAAAPSSIETVVAWTPEDREAVTALAVDQAAWSRFARDPAFAGAVAGMYRTWVGHAFTGELDALVQRDGGRIVGMLMSEVKDGVPWIELIDVSAAHRGHGTGLALVRAFLARAANTGHSQARVRTQLRNTVAIRTYERAGFTLSRIGFVLHWWTGR